MEQADADLRAMAQLKGWGDQGVEMAKSVMIHGDPDTVGERLEAMMATGIDGLTINMIANGHVPGRVSLLGEVAGRVIG
jgi:alkanesulfonate monooxygenase SsuD/methylene tetrahydromethanopterin reductase-like flavin-dependent oxidoreductase (luciferase family)